MLALITFISTIIIGIAPNTDTYTRTVNEYHSDGANSSRTELISEWNYDSEKGWIFEMPEIEIIGGAAVNTAQTESNWILELPEINITGSNS